MAAENPLRPPDMTLAHTPDQEVPTARISDGTHTVDITKQGDILLLQVSTQEQSLFSAAVLPDNRVQVLFDAHTAPLSSRSQAAEELVATSEQAAVLALVPPAAPSVPAPEASPDKEVPTLAVKANLGRDPFLVTTPDGPLLVMVAYFREVNGKAIPNDKARSYKIAVAKEQKGFLISPDAVDEANPRGYLLRQGDFLKASLTPHTFTQIQGSGEKAKQIEVRGYRFVEQPTLLRAKSRNQE